MTTLMWADLLVLAALASAACATAAALIGVRRLLAPEPAKCPGCSSYDRRVSKPRNGYSARCARCRSEIRQGRRERAPRDRAREWIALLEHRYTGERA